jgi:hypothetical protein
MRTRKHARATSKYFPAADMNSTFPNSADAPTQTTAVLHDRHLYKSYLDAAVADRRSGPRRSISQWGNMCARALR